MPIYEYRRPDGSTFEVMQSFSDDPLKKDPETGVPVERVLHAPAIHFKGKGFHNTDYGTRRRNRELEKSAESGANDYADKQSEKKDADKPKSESKPADKPKADKPKKDKKAA
jgi:putative FmdB family regulatory protein